MFPFLVVFPLSLHWPKISCFLGPTTTTNWSWKSYADFCQLQLEILLMQHMFSPTSLDSRSALAFHRMFSLAFCPSPGQWLFLVKLPFLYLDLDLWILLVGFCLRQWFRLWSMSSDQFSTFFVSLVPICLFRFCNNPFRFHFFMVLRTLPVSFRRNFKRHPWASQANHCVSFHCPNSGMDFRWRTTAVVIPSPILHGKPSFQPYFPLFELPPLSAGSRLRFRRLSKVSLPHISRDSSDCQFVSGVFPTLGRTIFSRFRLLCLRDAVMWPSSCRNRSSKLTSYSITHNAEWFMRRETWISTGIYDWEDWLRNDVIGDSTNSPKYAISILIIQDGKYSLLVTKKCFDTSLRWRCKNYFG